MDSDSMLEKLFSSLRASPRDAQTDLIITEILFNLS